MMVTETVAKIAAIDGMLSDMYTHMENISITWDHFIQTARLFARTVANESIYREDVKRLYTYFASMINILDKEA